MVRCSAEQVKHAGPKPNAIYFKPKVFSFAVTSLRYDRPVLKQGVGEKVPGDTIIMTGATGRLGRAVVAALSPQYALHALVRRADDPRLPAEVRQSAASLSDVAALTEAFEGARQAIVILPDHPDVPGMMKAILVAAEACGVERIIKISAHLASETPPRSFGIEHAPADEMLRNSGIEAVILRPAMFMQSLALFLGDIAKGRMIVPVPSGKVALIDAGDIAAVIGKALEGGVAPATYMLTGPESHSFGDVAAALSRWSGQPIKHIAPPRWVAGLVMRFDSSLDAFNRTRLLDFLGALEEGLEAPLFPALEELLGRPGRSLGAFLAASAPYDNQPPVF
jgi:uncharacterized protein YbjT (DUF2867 family)